MTSAEREMDEGVQEILKQLDRITQMMDEALANGATNGRLIHQGLVPCETNPDTGGLSRTGDPAHALAAYTVTGKGFESRHVCRECAIQFYMHRPIKDGVIWS